MEKLLSLLCSSLCFLFIPFCSFLPSPFGYFLISVFVYIFLFLSLSQISFLFPQLFPCHFPSPPPLCSAYPGLSVSPTRHAASWRLLSGGGCLYLPPLFLPGHLQCGLHPASIRRALCLQLRRAAPGIRLSAGPSVSALALLPWPGTLVPLLPLSCSVADLLLHPLHCSPLPSH